MNKIIARLRPVFVSSWHPFAWFFVFGLALYGQTLMFDFSYLDDQVLVLDHLPQLKNFAQIGQAFRSDVFHLAGKSASYYRPLLTLSFMGSAFLSGANPGGYHFVNILIHLIAVGLVFVLLLRAGCERAKSFFLALLMLVHPALVQAVAWIPGRNDSLAAVFILLSFLFFLKDITVHRKGDYLGHLIFFFCALLTKESAIALPAVGLLYYFFIAKDRFLISAPRMAFGWLGCLFFWAALRMSVVRGDALLVKAGLAAIAANSSAYFLYLGKVFFPFNLSVLPILQDSRLGFGFLSTALLLVAAACSKRRTWPRIAFGLSWFFIFLFFALIRSTTPWAPADFLEHRLYVPMAGFAFVFAAIELPGNFWHKIFFKGLLGALLCVFIVINVIYARNFKDRSDFWQNAVRTSPHAALAHANRGAMYYLEAKNEAALYEYAQALYLNPRQGMVHNNLGLIYMHQGQEAQAQEEFLQEIQINPRYADAYYNFGLLCYRQGRLAQARRLMQKTLTIDPAHASARRVLAEDCFRHGQAAEACDYFKELP